MSIACPHCNAVLNPKGLKPGKFTPKCPQCKKPFLIVVPDDEGETISVQRIPQPRPTAVPDTDRVPAIKPPTPRPAPPKKPMSIEDAAAAMLEGRDPGDMTGDFTEADEPEPPKPVMKRLPSVINPGTPRPAPKPAPKHDPNATGDFTETDEVEAPKKPVPKKPPLKAKHDPNATGDFTEPGDEAKPSVGDATGDFTEAPDDETPSKAVARGPKPTKKSAEATNPMATGDFSEDSDGDKVEEKPKAVLKPAKKAKVTAEAAADLDDDVPPRLGGYEVLKVLGKGGMGAVLLGRQISLDRKVALKVMHPKIAQNPSFVARFTREAYAAAQLTHHNVIQIYDIGEDRGQHFFSMEFVQGQSLGDLIKKEGKLPADVAIGYILQAARGLRYGHKQGMVHRDIKPDNLMMNEEGIVKVADMGLVKLPAGELPSEAGALPPTEDGEEGDTNLTRAGAVMGTPAYMSPEQSRDSASVDGRADIYSLGCSLYVLITGRPPFEGKTAMEVISKHQTEPMVPPEVVVKRIPKAVSAIVLKMTAKEPDERYQSMDEVIVALEHFLGLEKAGDFNPKEEQADQLEKCVHQFNFRSKGGLKLTLALGFVAVCLLGIVGGAFAEMPALAGGLVGLMFLAPLAYFVIHGMLTGGVVFTKARELVLGMRAFDWLTIFAGGALLLVTLYLFGMLWSWLGFVALAVGLGFLVWFLTDRAQVLAQEVPLDDARSLFRSLRLAGLDEEQLRQFVCKFTGSNWEPFFEAVFGYEAKIAARALRKGDTGEVSKKAGTWREPVLAWLDSRLEAHRTARERRHLQKIEAKALEAEGVSKADARAQAEAMAADLVDQAGEAKKARKEGKEVSVAVMVRSARARRRPQPGYNLAGVKLRSLWFKDFANEWLGRRLRLVLGAAVFALGLFWMNQNDLFGKTSNIFKQAMELNFAGAEKSLSAATGKPLRAPDFLPIPADVLQPISSINVPILGFLMLLSGLCYFGWRPSLVVIPGLIIGLAGPMLGVPDVPPLNANVLCLIIGAVLIVPAAWVLRQ